LVNIPRESADLRAGNATLSLATATYTCASADRLHATSRTMIPPRL